MLEYPLRRKAVLPGQRLFGERCRNVKRKALEQFVYRCGTAKFVKWGIFECRMKQFLPVYKRPNPKQVTRLQLEYLRPLLQKGVFFSLPDASMSAIDSTRHMLALEDAVSALDRSSAGQFNFFQVLDVNLRSRKLPRDCGAQVEMRTMCWPIRIQRWVTWNKIECPEANCDLHIVHEPETIDALELSHWPVVRIGLRQWTRTAGIVEGCIGVMQPLCLSLRPLDFSQRKVAALELLETLLRTGWQLGNPPHEHTLHADKVFKIKDAIAERLYLTCLVRLSEVIAASGTAVPSGQSAAAYAGYLEILGGKALALEKDNDAGDTLAIEDAMECDTLDINEPLFDDKPPPLNKSGAQSNFVARKPTS